MVAAKAGKRKLGVVSGNPHVEQIWGAKPQEPDSLQRAQISPR